MSLAQPPLSAILITLNAVHQLPACFDSLAFCAEIVVLDSGSTDGTQAYAQQRGARVIHAAWRGFGAQKQWAVDQASHDWVLCIDADERVSEHLREEILRLFSTGAKPEFQAYRFPRCNRFLGRYLRHGEGYPDWSLRLFHRQAARWSDDAVHEKVITTQPIGSLQSDLLHDSAESIDTYLSKQNRYTSLAAQQAIAHYQARGKRVHAGHLLLSPLLRFLKFYVFRCGFLDGLPGLTHILIGCANSFTKYAKILELQKRAEIPSASSSAKR